MNKAHSIRIMNRLGLETNLNLEYEGPLDFCDPVNGVGLLVALVICKTMKCNQLLLSADSLMESLDIDSHHMLPSAKISVRFAFSSEILVSVQNNP